MRQTLLTYIKDALRYGFSWTTHEAPEPEKRLPPGDYVNFLPTYQGMYFLSHLQVSIWTASS